MIDLIYIFHFRKEDKDEALERFKISLSSVDCRSFNVCVINCSEYCIKSFFDDKVKYIHVLKDYGVNLYNRSFMINECVKQLVTTEYFNISDIDIIYPNTFTKTIKSILKENDKPCRIVYYNNNMGVGDFKTYEECKSAYPNCKDHLRSLRGPAGGLGIVHTESFHKVGGFEERYIGYGPEDQDFNLRISRINKHIVLDDERINTYHLWHINNTPKIKFRENMRIFFYIRDYLKKYPNQIFKSGEIEIPQIVYHQSGNNIIEIEDFWSK